VKLFRAPGNAGKFKFYDVADRQRKKANARRRCPHSTFYGLVQSPDAPGGANSEAVVRFVTVDGRGEWCPHYTSRLLLRRG